MKKKYYKQFIQYILKFKKQFILYGIASIILMFARMISPYLSAQILRAFVESDLHHILVFACLVFMVEGIILVVFQMSYILIRKIQNEISLSLKTNISKEICKLKMENFDQTGTNFFIKIIHHESSNLIYRLLSDMSNSITNIVSGIGISCYIWIISWQMGIAFLMFSIFLAIIDHKRMIILKKYRANTNKIYEKNPSDFNDLIKDIRDIKVSNFTEIVANHIVKDQTMLNREDYDNCKKTGLLDISSSIFDRFFDFCIILFGAFLIYQEQLTGVNLLIIYMYRNYALKLVKFITNLYTDDFQILETLNRLFEVVDGETYPRELYGEQTFKHCTGNISFQNVSYSYSETPVLMDISFDINIGETVGIITSTEQEKTTIFNLFTKLYTVQEGKILLDHYNINELTEQTIRRHISVILQNPYIFNMSIKDNLKLVAPNATDEEIIACAKESTLDSFVQVLEGKYDTKIGEEGLRLSKEQGQLLAVTQALLKKSKIIVFAEAISSLDQETQAFIEKSIQHIRKNHTIIIFDDQLSTIKNCDKIIVIDDGQLVRIETDHILKGEN